MAKVTIDSLGTEIQRILQEYEADVENIAEDALKEVGKAGLSALKSSARSTFGGKGEYASGWKLKEEKSGLGGYKITLHNAKVPGLPHLLEYGHAKVGGGRVPGREHIASVEQEMIDSIQSMLEAKL